MFERWGNWSCRSGNGKWDSSACAKRTHGYGISAQKMRWYFDGSLKSGMHDANDTEVMTRAMQILNEICAFYISRFFFLELHSILVEYEKLCISIFFTSKLEHNIFSHFEHRRHLPRFEHAARTHKVQSTIHNASVHPHHQVTRVSRPQRRRSYVRFARTVW